MNSKPNGLATLLLPVLLLIVAMASIQSGASLAKSLFPAVGAQGATTLRLIFASLMLCAVLRPWRMTISAKTLKNVAIYGASLGAMNLLFYMALQSIPLGVAVALEFTGPLCVALLGSRRKVDFLWIALAALGLYLLIPTGETTAGLPLEGAAFALGAGACWAFYIHYGHKAGTDNGLQTVGLGATIAALVVMPFGIAHAGAALLDVSLVPVALAVAVLSTALPYSLEMVALTRMPPRTFGILMSMEPGIAALSGLIFLGELLTTPQWFALGAIILASAGATLTTRPAPTPAVMND